MMNWDHIALGISDLLGLMFVVRLLTLRLHTVYRVFSLFVIYELASFSITSLFIVIANPKLDYRIVYVVFEVLGSVLMLWMVYALLAAILVHLPGIHKASKKALNYTFVISIFIALFTGRAELAASPELASAAFSLDGAVDLSIVVERVISTAALAVLLLTLAFVLWFPVQMPRNLVFFSFGFLVYFAFKTGLSLAHSFLPADIAVQMGTLNMLIIDLCFLYWAITIRRDGEIVPIRIGHNWRKTEQQRLLEQLEGMNAALLRGARK